MMDWKVKYIPSLNIIFIKSKGHIPLEEFSKQFREAESLAREYRINRFLFDDTELDVKLSTLEIVDLSNWINDERIVKRSRIAILISPEYKRIENYKFLETAGRNRGVNLKLFFSKEDALEWLDS